MNWDRIEGNWVEFKGKVRTRWGKLTNDDLDVIGGKREQLIGVLQNRYGVARDELEREVKEFEKELDKETDRAVQAGRA
ncbi:MAG TPA: CsbD family protein [Gemmatimonadales bacterium]|nr:CsbD family protein [Gemmatimonadales bacterium]